MEYCENFRDVVIAETRGWRTELTRIAHGMRGPDTSLASFRSSRNRLAAMQPEIDSLRPGKSDLPRILEESEVPEAVYNSSTMDGSNEYTHSTMATAE